MKRYLLVAISLCWLCAPSLAQQGSGDPPNGVTTQATGTANAAVSNNSYGAVQLPNLTPILGTPGPIPAFSPVNPGETVVYSNALFQSLTMEQVRSLAREHGKRGKIKVAIEVADRNVVSENDDPVHFLTFLPKPGHVIGIGYGESVGPVQEGNLAKVILGLKEQTHTRYVLILVTRGTAGVTKANTLGVTGLFSGLVSGKGLGVAPGYLQGASTTSATDVYTFRIIAFDFDKEPIEPPPASPTPAQPEAKPQAPPPAPQPKAEELKEATPAVTQPSIQPTTPVPQAPPPEAACTEILQFVVYFDFDRPLKDHYDIKPESMPEIERAAKWLADHKSCRLEIEGHTDQIGSYDYNSGLGRRRSRAVYLAILEKDETLQERLKFSSFSKDRPVSSEYRDLNRRVILHVVGPESSK